MPTKLEAEPVELDIPVAAPSAAPAAVVSPTVSKAFDMTDYFTRREQEEKQGGDAGLLPLKPKPTKDAMDEEGMRQRLLAGANAKGMGARELQEELSGQLAGVSVAEPISADNSDVASAEVERTSVQQQPREREESPAALARRART